jgi:hypothetical protein
VSTPIEISLAEWEQAEQLYCFLCEREREARLSSEPPPLIVVDPAPDDPAGIEVYVALHTFLESGVAPELTLRVEGRDYPMRGTPTVRRPPARRPPLPRVSPHPPLAVPSPRESAQGG